MSAATGWVSDLLRPYCGRGWVVALVIENRASYVNGPDRLTVGIELALATGLTREHRLRMVRRFARGDTPSPVERIVGLRQVLTIPGLRSAQGEELARSHTWPGGQPWRPWETLDELRRDVVPLLDAMTQAQREEAIR